MNKRSPSKVPASWRGPAAPEEAPAPKRYVTDDDLRDCRPVYAVWEITLKCDLACNHCGSRAGKARPSELSTDECFDVVDQLAALGCREVTVIGGEAYLRKDWVDIIARIRDRGMDARMTTGARNLTEERVKAAADAGLQGVSVSIDGIEETHDRIRGVHGSHRAAIEAIHRLKAHGITAGCNTQSNALSWKQLPEVMETIINAGATHWQVQLTVAMGNAVDHPELLLQPWQLGELYPELARLYLEGFERGLLMMPGNNIGYFGPYEHLCRGGHDRKGHWISCNAGQNTIGLEADGTIKGACLQRWCGAPGAACTSIHRRSPARTAEATSRCSAGSSSAPSRRSKERSPGSRRSSSGPDVRNQLGGRGIAGSLGTDCRRTVIPPCASPASARTSPASRNTERESGSRPGPECTLPTLSIPSGRPPSRATTADFTSRKSTSVGTRSLASVRKSIFCTAPSTSSTSGGMAIA